MNKMACVPAAFDRSAEQQQKAFGSTNQVLFGAQEPAGKLNSCVSSVSRNHQVVLLNDFGDHHNFPPGNTVLLQDSAN